MGTITPLHVLLTVMRSRWDQDDFPGAVALAKIAAPYVHPRATSSRTSGDLAEVGDEELEGGEEEGEGV